MLMTFSCDAAKGLHAEGFISDPSILGCSKCRRSMER